MTPLNPGGIFFGLRSVAESTRCMDSATTPSAPRGMTGVCCNLTMGARQPKGVQAHSLPKGVQAPLTVMPREVAESTRRMDSAPSPAKENLSCSASAS